MYTVNIEEAKIHASKATELAFLIQQVLMKNGFLPDDPTQAGLVILAYQLKFCTELHRLLEPNTLNLKPGSEEWRLTVDMICMQVEVGLMRTLPSLVTTMGEVVRNQWKDGIPPEDKPNGNDH